MSVVLNTFASGLHNRTDPTLLSADAAEMFHNIDNAGGNMKSLKKPKPALNNYGFGANDLADKSFFYKDPIDNSETKYIAIDENSPVVIYDKWMYHRDSNGYMRVSQWRDFPNDSGFELSSYLHRDREVGLKLDTLTQFSAQNSNLQNNIQSIEFPEEQDFVDAPATFTSRSSANLQQFRDALRLSGFAETLNVAQSADKKLSLKFVLLNNKDEKVYDVDYNEVLRIYGNVYIDRGQFTEVGLRQPSGVNFSGNYQIYWKAGNSYYLVAEKKEGQISPMLYAFNWSNLPTEQSRIWSGRDQDADISDRNYGYYLIEVLSEKGGLPSEDNPVILRSNPVYPIYVDSVLATDRVIALTIPDKANTYYEVYRIDQNNVIPVRIKLAVKVGSADPVIKEYLSAEDRAEGTLIYDALNSSSLYRFLFTDLDNDEVYCPDVQQLINNGTLTTENMVAFRNCFRKTKSIGYNNIPIVDERKKANLDNDINQGVPYFIRIPISSIESQLLTEYDHDSPNDEQVHIYNNNNKMLETEIHPELKLKGEKPAMIEAYGRLWASSGRFVRFSKPGEPEYWPRGNSLSFNDNITGLLQVSNGILVFTADETYLVVGSSLNEFAITLLTKEQGCIAPRSCGYIQSVPIWMCKDGIATYEGGRVIVRSRPIISEETTNKVMRGFVCAEVHNEQYFALYKPTVGSNKSEILVMDLRYGVSFYTMDGDLPDNNYIRDLRMYEDTLYAVGTDNKIYEMFKGEDYYSITYKSPIITEGSTTILKEIDCIYISVNNANPFSVKCIINGKSKSLLENANIAAISQEMSIAEEDRRFEQIQVEITGVVSGYIREIRFLSTAADKKLKEFV